VTNGGVAAAARHPGSSNGGATAARPAGSIRPAVLQRKLSWVSSFSADKLLEYFLFSFSLFLAIDLSRCV